MRWGVGEAAVLQAHHAYQQTHKAQIKAHELRHVPLRKLGDVVVFRCPDYGYAVASFQPCQSPDDDC